MKEYEKILMTKEKVKEFKEYIKTLDRGYLIKLIKYLEITGQNRINNARYRLIDDEIERRLRQEKIMLRG